jgi:hypothetical protein
MPMKKVKYPKQNILHIKHGKSLKSRNMVIFMEVCLVKTFNLYGSMLVRIRSLVCALLCFKNEIFVLHIGPTVCKT